MLTQMKVQMYTELCITPSIFVCSTCLYNRLHLSLFKHPTSQQVPSWEFPGHCMPGNRVKAFLGNPIFQLLILRKHPLLGYYCFFQSSFQLVDHWQCLEGQLTRNMNPVRQMNKNYSSVCSAQRWKTVLNCLPRIIHTHGNLENSLANSTEYREKGGRVRDFIPITIWLDFELLLMKSVIKIEYLPSSNCTLRVALWF